MKQHQSIAVVIGVGPGLGLAIAKKFVAENFFTVIISRNKEQLSALIPQIDAANKNVAAFAADVTNEEEVISLFNEIKNKFGHPEVVIYNAAAKFELKGINDISSEDFIRSWKISCLGGLLVSQQVTPNMIKQSKGTIIFTGATAALRGSANMTAFAVGKFSQRALAQSMAKEFGPQGIHVVHVIIDGYIATPIVLKHFPDKPLDSFLNPKDIAETYWQLYRQDKCAWTHEIDLRPYTEKF